MSRNEEISKAAYSQYCNSESICFNLMCDSFKQGAKWADENPNLSSLWHDASEEPKGDDWKVLCQDKYGTYFIVEYRPYDSECDITWDEYTNSLFISKWAHITDLLPKGGEE